MAKARQRVKQDNPRRTETPDPLTTLPAWVVWSRRIAAAVLGGLMVYVAYFPSDSVLVENGDALWFCAIALVLFTLTMVGEPMIRQADGGNAGGEDPDGHNKQQSMTIGRLLGGGLIIDLLVWNLALWIVLAAFCTCPPGNLRMATNEAWLWVAAAAVISSARRLLVDESSRAMVLTITLAICSGLAVHAMHQQWISLPKTRADFIADPDKVLRDAGIVAPWLSSRRMIFASRVMDGGPTATFALANSLAAALMAAVVIPIGLLFNRRGSTDSTTRTTAERLSGGLWLLLLLTGGAAIIATRSRSAVLAALVGVACWLIARYSRSDKESGNANTAMTRLLPRVLLGLGAVATVIVMGVVLLGDEEWTAAAPASLQFRLQYWMGTARLLMEHPLMGSGPGGFQSLYLRYRLPIADETIADPHNFFFETLASGGIVAGVFLVAIASVMRRESKRQMQIEPTQRRDGPFAEAGSEGSRWLVLGSLVSLGLVWLFAFASNQLPDVQANLFAIPVAVGVAWASARPLAKMTEHDRRALVSGILIAIMVHLLVSGGWTVPGVALPIWLLLSMLTAVEKAEAADVSNAQSPASTLATRLSLGGLMVGIVLILAIRFVSIGPVQAAQFAQQRANDALQRGLTGRADNENSAAIADDDWAFESVRWRSEWLKEQLIESGDSLANRQAWESTLETLMQRSGRNPLVMRAIGEQYLHLYQRFAKRGDLDQAAMWIGSALKSNPTDASLSAQSALIAAERSQPAEFETLRDRAWELSLLGGNLTRHLDVQFVYLVQPVGASASRLAKMDRASKLLADRETKANRIGASGVAPEPSS